MGNTSKTHGKRMGNDWNLDVLAVLSSTQQCSICNQFGGVLAFCKISRWKRAKKSTWWIMKVQKPTNIRKYLKDQEKTNKGYLYKTKGNICKPNLNWKLCSTTRFFQQFIIDSNGFLKFQIKTNQGNVCDILWLWGFGWMAITPEIVLHWSIGRWCSLWIKTWNLGL